MRVIEDLSKQKWVSLESYERLEKELHELIAQVQFNVVMADWLPGETLKSVEIRATRQALEYYKGDKSRTARELGISVRTIRYMVLKYPELRRWKKDHPNDHTDYHKGKGA